MNSQVARTFVETVLARDELRLPPEEVDRLVSIYADEARAQLATLRDADADQAEPAAVYLANG